MDNGFPLRFMLILVLLCWKQGSAFLNIDWFDDHSNGILKPSEAHTSRNDRQGQKEKTHGSFFGRFKRSQDETAGTKQSSRSRMTFGEFQRYRDAFRNKKAAQWLPEESAEGEKSRENAEGYQEENPKRLPEEWEEIDRMAREQGKRRRMEDVKEKYEEGHGWKGSNSEQRRRYDERPEPEDPSGVAEDGRMQRERKRPPETSAERQNKKTRHEGDEEERTWMDGKRYSNEREEHSAGPRKKRERKDRLDEEAARKRREHRYQSDQTWDERGSENSEGVRGKPAATIFPYNAIAGIVSIIWLVNILFIAWLVFGRESYNNMRIPSNFEYKPPIKIARSRSLPLADEQVHDAGAEKSTHLEKNCVEDLESTHPSPPKPPFPRSSPAAGTVQRPTAHSWSPLNVDSPQPSPPSPRYTQPTPRPAPDAPTWSPKRLNPCDFSSLSARRAQAARNTEFVSAFSLASGDRERNVHTSPIKSYMSGLRSMYESSFAGRDGERTGSYTPETEKLRAYFSSNTQEVHVSPGRPRASYREREQFRLGNMMPRFTNYNASKLEATDDGAIDGKANDGEVDRQETRRQGAGNKAEKGPTVRWKDNGTNKCASSNRSMLEEDTDLKETKSSGSMGIDVYDIKEFVSLPDEILDALTCTRTGQCLHDHNKYRMVGDKLYILSSIPQEQQSCTELSPVICINETSEHELGRSKILLQKQSNFNKSPRTISQKSEQKQEGKASEKQSVGLSPIPQDVSTQISPGVFHESKLSQQTVITTSVTTQCPSSFTVARDTMEKESLKTQFYSRLEREQNIHPSTDAMSRKIVLASGKILSSQEETLKTVCVPQQSEIADRDSLCVSHSRALLQAKNEANMKEFTKSQRSTGCSESISCMKNKTVTRKIENQGIIEIQQKHMPNKRLSEIKVAVTKTESNARHIKDCTTMAPPPLGYHVRKEYSSSESTMDELEKVNVGTARDKQDVPGPTKRKDFKPCKKQSLAQLDTGAQRKIESEVLKTKTPDDVQTCLSSTKVSKDKCGEEKSPEIDDSTKASKRLMIIGKLNYFNVGRQRKDNNEAKTVLHFGLSRCAEHRKDDAQANKGNKSVHRTPKYLSLRHKPKKMIMGVPAECKNACGEGYLREKTLKEPAHLPVSQESAMWLYKSMDHPDQIIGRYGPKNNSRRSDGLRRTLKTVSHNGQGSKQRAKDRKRKSKLCPFGGAKLKASFSPRHAEKRHFLPRAIAKHVDHTSGDANFLPSYYLNVNTNAGIIDNCGDDPRTDTKQMSTTSVHSNDQYFSTHTDTPDGRNIDSDVEVSQSFSFTDDMDKIVASQPQEHDLAGNKGGEQDKQLTEGWEEKKQNIMQACNEAIKNRLQRRNVEQMLSEECVAYNDKTSPKMTPNTTSVVSQETPTMPTSKHKKKTKTTEALYFKFESSMSKKVTTTTVVKDGRKLSQNKPKQEQKQLSAGEAHRAIAGLQEKSDKKYAVETPRHTKIIRCSDGMENGDARPKHKQYSDTNIESTAAKDSHRQSRATEKTAVRSTESDHRSSVVKDIINGTCKSEDLNYVKQIICLPTKDLPPLESPESLKSPRGHVERRTEVADSDKASEKGSSVITVVHLLPSQTSLQRDIANRDLSQVKDVLTSDRKSERSESPISQRSPLLEGSPRKRVRTRSKGESSSRKTSPEPGSKHTSKPKKPALKNKTKPTEESAKDAHSDDGSETARIKALQQQISALRKRSPLRKKLHSRSPDMKKKRRNTKKKDAHSDSKSEDDDTKTVKKQKTGEKGTEKKKKKRKVSSHSDDEVYLDGAKTDKKVSRSRSRSSDAQKATQTVSCSAFSPRFVETLVQNAERNKAGSLVWKNQTKEPEERSGKEKTYAGDDYIRSMDREFANKTRDQRYRNFEASEENASIGSGTGMQIRSAESISTFTGALYKTPTKVVHVPSCPQGRKTDKDLQQAEMGWNSSMVSDATKAAAEKARCAQRRSKMRYYIVKPKPRQTQHQIVGVSKLKRPSIQHTNADGDGAGSNSDLDIKGDIYPRERNSTGQGKSVQFSDSIEELEPSKIDIQYDSSASPDRQDLLGISHETGNPVFDEALCAEMDASRESKAETPKLDLVKKEPDQRAHNTPPRRKKPVWLKKSANSQAKAELKDNKAKLATKANTVSKNAIVPAKNALIAAGLPLKMRHSTDNLVKPGSRFNVHVYYPVKPTCGSPKTSNISLNEKRAVAYNSWINSVFLAAPLNKATKKLVAKVGSPVDIKEIIEGSSVDAADHFRMMRSLQEASLRTAKSVPAYGPPRPPAVPVSGGKQAKPQKAAKGLPAKKPKEPKPQESGSSRSLSSVGISEDSLSSATQLGPINRNVTMGSTFALSTDLDEAAAWKPKTGLNRRLALSRRRDKKPIKRPIQPLEEAVDWHIVAAQDAESSQALNRMHYYGDMELNVLNMGIAWMVQSVFNRLSFFSPRHQSPNANASGDMPSNQQIID